MKRIAVLVSVFCLASTVAATTAFGFAAGFQYLGVVKGQETSEVGFSVEKSASGRKHVTGFTVLRVAYDCSDAPPGSTTGGWVFDSRPRVESRRFEGRGEWVGLHLDPVGKLSGRLKPGGRASGSLKLTGELAGPGTRCSTGLVDWKASKAA